MIQKRKQKRKAFRLALFTALSATVVLGVKSRKRGLYSSSYVESSELHGEFVGFSEACEYTPEAGKHTGRSVLEGASTSRIASTNKIARTDKITIYRVDIIHEQSQLNSCLVQGMNR